MTEETAPPPAEDPFEQAPSPAEYGTLVLDVDGYEGPMDVLLALAREQKVDLKKISILQLAEQYLAFIQEMRRVRLEIAADYLVMAAWLAYLKSKLLLPEPETEEEGLSGAEMAERLAFQLRRLEAMRNVGAKLMARHQFKVDFFPRGAPEGVRVLRRSVYELSLLELLKGYADYKVSRGSGEALRLRRTMVFTVEQALQRLTDMLGRVPEWSVLQTFLPPGLGDAFSQRSAMASTLIATLEMAKQGRVSIRQGQTFGPIYLRRLNTSSTETT